MTQDRRMSAPEPSGRFVVRLPRTLHADLPAEAEREGVSLNQFVVGALAGAVGWRAPAEDVPRSTGKTAHGSS